MSAEIRVVPDMLACSRATASGTTLRHHAEVAISLENFNSETPKPTSSVAKCLLWVAQVPFQSHARQFTPHTCVDSNVELISSTLVPVWLLSCHFVPCDLVSLCWGSFFG